MSVNRRDFMRSSALVAAATGLRASRTARPFAVSRSIDDATLKRGLAPGLPGKDYRPTVTPDGATLPFTIKNGVKVFHLVPEPVMHEFAPGLKAACWGYNGRVHGPTIEAVEGDRVRIYVTNNLPDPTTVHWHGILLPNGMDGVGGLTQRVIGPGETFKYEYTLRQHGTFMYHSHHDEMVQMALGVMGMFIIHPRHPAEPRVERDYVYLLSEWAIVPGTRRPDPNEMTDFNIFTFNAKAFPGTSNIVARTGERVRLRIGNLSATDHHPIHVHGTNFRVVETDGGVIPEAGRWPETTILVPVGSTRTVEFVADNPGDWIIHCHMTHHMMNQMGHGIPNLVGVDPAIVDEKLGSVLPDYLDAGQSGMGEHEHPAEAIPPNSIPMFGGSGPFGYINMGGMVAVLKVRDELPESAEPDWYQHPQGTVAEPATQEELDADEIKP